MKKKGFFFALDAILAMTVISLGMFIVLTSFSDAPSRTQLEIVAENLIDYLGSTRIGDINDPLIGVGGAYWVNGSISEASNVIVQQIGEFVARGDLVGAEGFSQAAVAGRIVDQYAVQIEVDGVSVLPLSPDADFLQSRQETRLLIAKDFLTYGVLNRTTFEMWGPSEVSVAVWER